VESGRPVKFKTIAELMAKMGYGGNSPEVKSIALLWLEAISGINFTQEESSHEAYERVAQYRASEKEATRLLGELTMRKHLSVHQIRTFHYAVEHPEVIAILENIRKLQAGDMAGR
jgi:hypothetical protein